MNTGDLLAYLKKLVDDNSIPLATALPWFNAGLDDLSLIAKELATATSPILTTKDEYTLPTNFLAGSMQTMTFKKDGEPRVYTLDRIDFSKVNLSADRGTPGFYYILDNRMGFYPRIDKDGSATAYYFKRLPQLIDANSVPTIGAVHHELVALYAATRYMQGQGDFTEARELMTEYELKKLRVPTDNVPRVVRVVDF